MLLGLGVLLVACGPAGVLAPPTQPAQVLPGGTNAASPHPPPSPAPATQTPDGLLASPAPATQTPHALVASPAAETPRPQVPSASPEPPTQAPEAEPPSPTPAPQSSELIRGAFDYSANPAPAGILVITIHFDRPLAVAPDIQVVRPGVESNPPEPMTGAGAEWQFDYHAEPAGDLQQMAEPLTVVVTGIEDLAGGSGPDLVDRSAYVYAPAEDAVLDGIDGLEFVKLERPVLEAGPAGAWDSGGVGLGDVLKVGDTYWMYYNSNRMDDPESAIGVATSPDGLTWTKYPDPVIAPGAPGEWNSLQVSHPSVLWDNGQFHMWFVGQPQDGDMYSFRFGHTTSADGIHWAPATPVLGPGSAGEWDEERIGGLDVVKIGDGFYLYYTASTLTPEFKRQIGCAISGDGETWLKCEQNPVLKPRPNGQPFEGNEVEGPNVVSLYGIWLMAYTGYGGSQGPHFEIGLARSLDGLDWKRVSKSAVLPWGPDGSFDADGTAQPALLVEGTRLWLWYTGQSEAGSAIGLATADLK